MDYGEVQVDVIEQLVGVTETHSSEVSHSSVEMSDQVERSLGGHVQEEGRRSSGNSSMGIWEFDVSHKWECMWEDRVQLEAVQHEDCEHWEEDKRRRKDMSSK